MDVTSYALRLAPGVYMDQDGNVIQTVPPATPTMDVPFKLPFDPSQLRDVAKTVSEGVKDATKNRGFLLALRVWGDIADPAQSNVIGFLKGLANIASALSVVGSALGAAFAVAKMFGFLKDSPSAVEQLVDARFKQLDARFPAIAAIMQQQHLDVARSNLAELTSNARDLAKQTNQLTIDQYLDKQGALEGTLSTLNAAIRNIFLPGTWDNLLPDSNHRTWDTLAGRLFLFPSVDPSVVPPQPEQVQSSWRNTAFFDHRLMVPLAASTVHQFITALRVISPEYRSNGDSRSDLRDMAMGLENLARGMRDNSLARTVYTAGHFGGVASTEVDGPAFGQASAMRVSKRCTQWTVGAMDVLYHDDAFFEPFTSQLSYLLSNLQTPTETKFGCLDFAWTPPAKLAKNPPDENIQGDTGYVITNPQECADAANAQAEKDHAYLLCLSGYTQLLQLAAMTRMEATEPLHSQTVTTTDPSVMYQTVSGGEVTVETPPVQFTGEVFSAKAYREQRRTSAIAHFATQPIRRKTPAGYRVRLRALYDLAPYDDYFRTYYPGKDAQGFLRMEILLSNIESGSALLTPGGAWLTTPRDGSLHLGDTANLQVDTVDWWEPVDDEIFASSGGALSPLELSMFGRKTWHVPHFPKPLPKPSPGLSDEPISQTSALGLDVDAFPGFAWQAPAKNDRQARDKQRKSVSIPWTLDWEEERLTVTLQAEPEARSFVVYVVVEELLQGSRNIMHSAVAVPFEGLVTRVPQSLLDKEFAARIGAASVIAKQIPVIVSNPSELGHPVPPDPAFLNPQQVQRDVEFLRKNRPESFRRLSDAVRRDLNR